MIAGNQQYDTNGIVLNHTNKDPGGVHLATSFQSSNDLRGNLLRGAYHWNWTYNGGHGGGIQLGYGTYLCATACLQDPAAAGYRLRYHDRAQRRDPGRCNRAERAVPADRCDRIEFGVEARGLRTQRD